MSLEHPSVRLTHLSIRTAEMNRACSITRAIAILPARIAIQSLINEDSTNVRKQLT